MLNSLLDDSINNQIYVNKFDRFKKYILLFLVIVLSFGEILLSFIFSQQIVCSSKFYFSIKTFLKVHGSWNICVIIVWIFMNQIVNKYIFRNEIKYLIYDIGQTIIDVVNANLILFGAKVFWTECYDLTPEILNLLMWIILVFGFLSNGLLQSVTISFEK